MTIQVLLIFTKNFTMFGSNTEKSEYLSESKIVVY